MLTGPIDDLLRGHAADQYGVLLRPSVKAAGLTDRQIARRVASGQWRKRSNRVYVVDGTPGGPEQELLAAAWSVDGAASHSSGAWLHDVLDDPPEPPHVSSLTNRGRNADGDWLVLHRPDALPTQDLTRRRGIPVTTVERTLIDLGAVVDLETLRGCVDRALRSRLTHVSRLIRRHLELGSRGRPGSGAARIVLAEIDADLALLESDLESMLLRLIEAAGLPRPTLQHRVEVDGRRYRLDMAYPDLRIAIEADGFAVHGGRQAFESDHERRTALTVAGWQVLEFTWRQICRQPDWVVGQIRTAIEKAVARRGR